MRLRRIDLPGFGCLADFGAEFAPGLNVFFGDNEAGKSTLQQAVCALLYGFFDGDRARPDETARHERFRPWPESGPATPYRGSLEYELEDGRAFEVRRDFATGDVPTQLIDTVTGADVASQYGHGRHGNVPFARKQIGVSRAVFQSCAFIGQGEVIEVSNGASPREIGDAIAALADSSRRDVSAKVAMDHLDNLLQRIGSDRARTAALPSTREALRVAEAELAALDAAQRAVSQSAAELRTVRGRLSTLERDVVRGQVLFLKARSASVGRKLNQLAETDAAIERAAGTMSGTASFAEFPAAQREAVVRLRDRLAADRQAAADARRVLEERRARTSEGDRLEFEALRTSVGSLGDDSISAMKAVAYAASDMPAPRPNVLLRIWRALARFAAALVRVVLRRQPEAVLDADEPAAPTVSREEARALLERHTRYLTLRPEVEALVESEARLRTVEAAMATSGSELRGILDAAGIEAEHELGWAVEEFLESCRQHTLHRVAEAEGDEAARRRKLLLGERSPEELRGQSDECDKRLAALLAVNPELSGLEPETGAGEIAKRLEGIQAESQALEIRAARLEEEVRSSLKDHRARAEIEEDAERLRREVSRLEAARAAAQMAREAIGEAMVIVYRDFAPAVNAFLSEGFDYITEGRYRRAHVDPATLRVSLLLPETGRVITDPPVSRGTLTAAYVLMRMGLAHHMSAIGEPVPLVLDDPFVDLDGHRLERMLEFILRTTEGTQVLLFTKDSYVLEWFRANGADGGHALHLLSPAALVTSPL